jgi:pyridoxal phosphate enzyme (YggS family)
VATEDSTLAKNLASIRARIDRACGLVGRDPASVTLIAVTKTVDAEAIRSAYDLGVRDFGENRFQEALQKMNAMPPDTVWHFIGKLQSNKARKVADRFAAIHTLESSSQLKELDKADHQVDCLIEVNIAEEPQKSGIPAKMLDEFVNSIAEYKTVRFRGLMTVGPAMQNPELMRPYFKRMRELRESVGGEWLSMGMSNDFDVAIQEGATHVRVGTALFGERALYLKTPTPSEG